MVKASDVNLTLTNQAFNYGTGVFEGIRAYRNYRGTNLNVFRLQNHFERFIQSANALNIELDWSVDDFCDATVRLIKENELLTDCYIRPMAFKTALLPGVGFGVKLNGVDHGFSITALPMERYANTSGIRCGLSKWKRTPNESIPSNAKITGGYVNSALAMESARSSGFDDAILLGCDGYITEATTANVFLVKDNQLLTPKKRNILPGITRDSVMTIAKQPLELNIIEADLTLDDLLAADECFLTGTGIEITPAINIEGIKIGNEKRGRITETLMTYYEAIVRGENPDYVHWLTLVK